MISIIIPVVRRDRIEQLISTITLNAGIYDYEIETEEDIKRIGCPKMVKRLVEKSKGEMVCFLGDDTVPQPGFLLNALTAMSGLLDGWGLVGLNDEHQNGNKLATHWLADKRLLPLLDGEFFHTGYKHTRCDRELTVRCQQMGRYVWAKDAVVKHEHPAFGSGKFDEDYERVYSKEYIEHDKWLFRRRAQNNWQTPGVKNE